jgi:flagellar basal body-associated protein FliL
MPTHPDTPRRCGDRSSRVRVERALAALALLVAPGCFDRSALEQAQQQETDLVRAAEIELGEFRITLPHEPGTRARGVVEFKAFGRVAARDRDKVAKALAMTGPELRYRVLMAVRALTPKQLEEPTLQTLRGQLVKLANASLDKQVITSVGFYKFTFNTL